MSTGRMGEFERRAAAAADPATGPAPNTAGPHRSDLLNKLDPRVDSDLDGSATLGSHKPVQSAHSVPGTTVPATSRVPEGTYGPHSTRAANAIDPRVDSELDSSRRAGAREYGGTSRIPEGTYGPHSTRAANAIDPRVDSDLDSSRRAGAREYGGTSRVPEGTYGPHSTRMANAVDPRVDSDLDSSRRAGARDYAATSRAPHEVAGGARAPHGIPAATRPVEPRPGGYIPEGTYGPHHSRLANALDPRVDSDLDGSRTMGGTRPAQPYTGPAPTTAGPHRTDLGNRLDPNVDSTLHGRYAE